VGLRPEAVRVGDGPLRARIRTVEDLGSEVFVHVALEHRGENLPLVSKMPAPFAGRPGDDVGMQIVGATYLFAEDGSSLSIGTASLSEGERWSAGRS
jgi:multiple sugar transport system ATP-binding protein